VLELTPPEMVTCAAEAGYTHVGIRLLPATTTEPADSHGLGAGLEFMPWTDAKDLPQAARIIERTSRDNAGLLIDPFHFSRSRSRIEDIAMVPPSRFHFMQFCDVPSAIPPTMDEILAEARGERLFPGEGGVDLLGLLRAVPRDLPLSVEVPRLTLAKTVDAIERARRALAATKRVLAQLDNESTAAGQPASDRNERG
jgi:sugar phosphate isomerase/epimerase